MYFVVEKMQALRIADPRIQADYVSLWLLPTDVAAPYTRRRQKEPPPMPSIKPSQKSAVSPPILIIPELEHTKRAALSTLASMNSRRAYKHAIDRFIAWYCSEPFASTAVHLRSGTPFGFLPESMFTFSGIPTQPSGLSSLAPRFGVVCSHVIERRLRHVLHFVGMGNMVRPLVCSSEPNDARLPIHR